MPGTIAKIKGIHVNAGMFVPATNIDLVGSPSKKGPCRASVLYGRNGSGKTTISEEIAAIASSREHVHSYLYDQDGAQFELDDSELKRIRVFNERYVQEKILIKEEGLETIIMLGDQATAQKRLDEIDQESVKLGKKLVQCEELKNRLESGPKSLAQLETAAKKAAKDGGWSARRELVEGRKPPLTQGRWDAIVSKKINETRQALQVSFDSNLKKYSSAVAVGTKIKVLAPTVDESLYDESGLIDLLAQELDTPELSERELRILSLVQDGDQDIVERARETFGDQHAKRCPMCQQKLTNEYRISLVSSILAVLSQESDAYKCALNNATFPTIYDEQDYTGIPSTVIEHYQRCIRIANATIAKYNELIAQRSEALYNPVKTEPLHLCEAIINVNEASSAINTEIKRINSTIDEKDKLKNLLLEINDSIARIDADEGLSAYFEALAQLVNARNELEELRSSQAKLAEERGREESKVRMTEIAVKAINKHLAIVYFDTKRFTLVPADGVYKIESYGSRVRPGDISTGERNILALCYFFSEAGRGKFEGSLDKDAQYVVLDDPISSFDMENRVGILSLIQSRAQHILTGNKESMLTVLTHDPSVAAKTHTMLSNVAKSCKGTELQFCVKCLELRNRQIVCYQVKKGEYAILLKRAYDFAVSTGDDMADSQVIGNVLRRVLEGYSSFNYGTGIGELVQDKELTSRIGIDAEVLHGMTYRLVLDNESHMEKRLKSNVPSESIECFGIAEKRIIARFVIVMLAGLDSQHVIKLLGQFGIRRDELSRNVSVWKTNFSPMSTNDKAFQDTPTLTPNHKTL